MCYCPLCGRAMSPSESCRATVPFAIQQCLLQDDIARLSPLQYNNVSFVIMSRGYLQIRYSIPVQGCENNYVWVKMALQLLLQLMNIMHLNDTRERKLQLKVKKKRKKREKKCRVFWTGLGKCIHAKNLLIILLNLKNSDSELWPRRPYPCPKPYLEKRQKLRRMSPWTRQGRPSRRLVCSKNWCT